MPVESTGGAAESAESADYSFAVEYDGPPLPYAIPQAIPIEIDQIPVASVVSDEDSLLLPVVDPISSPKRFSASKKAVAVACDSIVSPTSVIGYDRTVVDAAQVSGEIWSSCDVAEPEESVDFSNDTNLPRDLVSAESVASSEFGFCSDRDQDHPLPVVTFQESSNSVTSSPRMDERRRNLKKGSCYRCFKGNRFTDKEHCIVCSAKYCSKCVLKAMGSMPEGRKCLSCIGYPIDESRRERLGKCSRMLKRLLCSLEVEQVMKSERYCDANQLRSEYVSVNGKPLSSDEMILLQSSPNPPKLKPGHYWYDKVSGFWGKEGRKPHKIVSPHLNIGGCLMENASNGNTGIFVNGREITNPEVRMLKLAGVQCAGSPHFWLNADGTYQEEGHKIIKGNLWEKAGMKLACSILSLPFPYKVTNPLEGEASDITSKPAPDFHEQRLLQKILLVGCNESGTSTIFNQAKILYRIVPFSDEERENIKVMIQGSIYHYLGILLEGRERFEEECLSDRRKSSLEQNQISGNVSNGRDDLIIYSLCPRLKAFSDFLLKVRASGNLEAIFPAATREYAPLVEELWNDASIQATYRRKGELQALPVIASYFLERVVDISKPEYEPSDMDILYADEIATSNGLACTEFSFRNTVHDYCAGTDNESQHENLFRYQLIRVHTKGLGENRKCLEMFEDARMVIFCAALSDYNEYFEDLNGVTINKMLASKKLFETIATNPTFEQMDFHLILNKFDVLVKKIEQTPITICDWFDDFNPITSRHNRNSGNRNNRNSYNDASSAEQAFYYIAVKFKRLFTSLTGRKLYVSLANVLDASSVDNALRYSREILKWEEEKIIFGTGEVSAYSTDPNSYSY